MMPGKYVFHLYIASILLLSACGVAEEVHINKLKVSSSNINENDVPLVYDDSDTFDISWSTPLQGGHSVILSITNSENTPDESSRLIVEQCTQHNSAVCRRDAVIECALNSDWILSCEDEQYALDMASQLLAISNEAFIHLQICNLFNNDCSRKYRRIIIVTET